jgi:tRNA (adenine22-N1)-methyltransferase
VPRQSSLRWRTMRTTVRRAMRTSEPRLEAVLSMLEPCTLLADVGTDHGYLPVWAVLRNVAERAIAADLRQAPLAIARRNIASAAVGDRVAAVQSDGLSALAERPVRAVVMAGMGGGLIASLCDRGGPVLAGVEQLVLQPNHGAELVRGWARSNGWHLHAERMVQVEQRFFVICAFRPRTGPDPLYAGDPKLISVLLRAGPLLVARRDPATVRFCEIQLARLQRLAAAGKGDHERRIADFQSAIACMH